MVFHHLCLLHLPPSAVPHGSFAAAQPPLCVPASQCRHRSCRSRPPTWNTEVRLNSFWEPGVTGSKQQHVPRPLTVNNYVGLSINGGSTIYGWLLIFLMENPIKMDDLGVPPHFGNLHMFMNQWFLPPHALKSTYIKVCRRRSTGWNPVKWQTVRIGNANSALAFKKS